MCVCVCVCVQLTNSLNLTSYFEFKYHEKNEFDMKFKSDVIWENLNFNCCEVP